MNIHRESTQKEVTLWKISKKDRKNHSFEKLSGALQDLNKQREVHKQLIAKLDGLPIENQSKHPISRMTWCNKTEK